MKIKCEFIFGFFLKIQFSPSLCGEGGTRTHQQFFTNQTAPDEQPLVKILKHLAAIGQLSQELLSSIQQDGHRAKLPARLEALGGKVTGSQIATLCP